MDSAQVQNLYWSVSDRQSWTVSYFPVPKLPQKKLIKTLKKPRDSLTSDIHEFLLCYGNFQNV
jgi:hypothetical protein